jgi:hypothetical protein
MSTPSIKDFDNYTQADEDKALEAISKDAVVKKHMIVHKTYYALMGDNKIIPLTLNISARDYEAIAAASNDEKAGMRLINRLAKQAGYQHDLEDLPISALTSLITDYLQVVNKTLGVDLGKSSDSAQSSTATADKR